MRYKEENAHYSDKHLKQTRSLKYSLLDVSYASAYIFRSNRSLENLNVNMYHILYQILSTQKFYAGTDITYMRSVPYKTQRSYTKKNFY